jgi:hypothetical protein
MFESAQPQANTSINQLDGPRRESWYLRVNDLVNHRALILEFAILLSANGFRRVAQVRAVAFHRLGANEVSKVAVQQLFDISSFKKNGDQVAIDDCHWSETSSRGTVKNARQTIEWELNFHPGPESVEIRSPTKSGLAGKFGKFLSTSLGEGVSALLNSHSWSSEPSQIDLRVTGSFKVNGEAFALNEAPGSAGRTLGGRLPHSSVWAQGSAFLNERGNRVTFAFEGLSLRDRLFGKVAGPATTNLFFLYQDKPYFFHSARNPLTVRSQSSISSWSFSAESGDLVFRGESRAEWRDFAGLTIEDTNGSFVHTATSLVSDLEVRVYRRGKIESAFYANGTGTLEFSQRAKNPYVPALV